MRGMQHIHTLSDKGMVKWKHFLPEQELDQIKLLSIRLKQKETVYIRLKQKKFFTSCPQLSCKKTFPKPWCLLKPCVFSKSKCQIQKKYSSKRASPMPDPKNIQRKCCYVLASLVYYLCICHFHFQEKTTCDSVVILVFFVCQCKYLYFCRNTTL